jgi:hypothetical protein
MDSVSFGSAKGRGARLQMNEELPHRRAKQAPFCAVFFRETGD